jgi:putative FmdB family regulatory protein
MPTYDYRCEHCGHELEIFQSITESAKRKCPACSRLKLKRIIGSGAGIIFKGSGFYQTDYRSDSYKSGAKKDKESSTKKSEGKKGESKKSDPGTKKGGDSKTSSS